MPYDMGPPLQPSAGEFRRTYTCCTERRKIKRQGIETIVPTEVGKEDWTQIRVDLFQYYFPLDGLRIAEVEEYEKGLRIPGMESDEERLRIPGMESDK